MDAVAEMDATGTSTRKVQRVAEKMVFTWPDSFMFNLSR